MAVYTDISDTELEAFLADFDAGKPLSFKGIAEGVENSNFLLETDAGRYILTIYERRVRAEDLPFFLSLMQWLASHGYPSAEPVADRTGAVLKSMRGKPAALISSCRAFRCVARLSRNAARPAKVWVGCMWPPPAFPAGGPTIWGRPRGPRWRRALRRPPMPSSRGSAR